MREIPANSDRSDARPGQAPHPIPLDYQRNIEDPLAWKWADAVGMAVGIFIGLPLLMCLVPTYWLFFGQSHSSQWKLAIWVIAVLLIEMSGLALAFGLIAPFIRKQLRK